MNDGVPLVIVFRRALFSCHVSLYCKIIGYVAISLSVMSVGFGIVWYRLNDQSESFCDL